MSGYYQQPQQFYPPPQNIYQQLGKAQPQPHLQSAPAYVPSTPQPQQQPAQYGYQTPYALTPSPYQQAPYPSQTPFMQQQQQPAYVPPPTPYQQPPAQYVQHPAQQPMQQFTQQPVQPVQMQPQTFPQQPQQIPSTFARPISSAGQNWKLPAAVKLPPLSPSASLAQSAKPQHMPMQAIPLQHSRSQSQPQTQVLPPGGQSQPSSFPHQVPQTPSSGRRPLPAPSSGAAPVPPPVRSATTGPFPIQTSVSASIVAPRSAVAPSPTRKRPLPTPTGGGPGSGINSIINNFNKRATIDGSTPLRSFPTSSFPENASISGLPPVGSAVSVLNGQRSQSPVEQSVPQPPPEPVKRRTSPPRFAASGGISPQKETPPSSFQEQDYGGGWEDPQSFVTSQPAGGHAQTSSSFSTQSSSSSSMTNATPTNSTITSMSSGARAPLTSSPASNPPQKFVPMWKRTIPDVPAPAWGYAAGVVKEPYAKSQPAASAGKAAPAPPPAAVPANAASPKTATKSKEKDKSPKGFSRFLKGSKKKGKEVEAAPPPAPAPAPAPAPPPAPAPAPAPAPPPALNHTQSQSSVDSQSKRLSGYPGYAYPFSQANHSQVQVQQDTQSQQPKGGPQTMNQASSAHGHSRSPAQTHYQGQETETTETDVTEEESQTGEEETGQEEASDEEIQYEQQHHQNYAQHKRHVTHPPASASGHERQPAAKKRHPTEEAPVHQVKQRKKAYVQYPVPPSSEEEEEEEEEEEDYEEDQDRTPRKNAYARSPGQKQPQVATRAHAYESQQRGSSSSPTKQSTVKVKPRKMPESPYDGYVSINPKARKAMERQRMMEQHYEEQEGAVEVEEEEYAPRRKSGLRNSANDQAYPSPRGTRESLNGMVQQQQSPSAISGKKGKIKIKEKVAFDGGREYMLNKLKKMKPVSNGQQYQIPLGGEPSSEPRIAHGRSRSATDDRRSKYEQDATNGKRPGSAFSRGHGKAYSYDQHHYQQEEEEEEEEEEEDEEEEEEDSDDDDDDEEEAVLAYTTDEGDDRRRKGRSSAKAKAASYRPPAQSEPAGWSQPAKRSSKIGSGLPQPPTPRETVGSAAAPVYARTPSRSPEKPQGGSKVKSGPINVSSGYVAAAVNHTGGSTPSGAWPSDLPRLPRTPGSAGIPGRDGQRGYFDAAHAQQQQQPQPQPQPPPRALPRSQPPAPPAMRMRPQSVPVASQQMQQISHKQMANSASRGPPSLEDLPPPASVLRSTSPVDGRPVFVDNPGSQRQGQQQQRRSGFSQQQQQQHPHPTQHGSQRPLGQLHQRPQTSFPTSSFSGLSQASAAATGPFSQQQRNKMQPQTPAPQHVVGVESPRPVGGREGRADLERLEESSVDGMSDREGSSYSPSSPGAMSEGLPSIHIIGDHGHEQPPPPVPSITIDFTGDQQRTANSSGTPRKRRELPQPRTNQTQPPRKAPQKQIFEIPGVSVVDTSASSAGNGAPAIPQIIAPGINISGPDEFDGGEETNASPLRFKPRFVGKGNGLQCAGCGNAIIGRIVNAMGSRWHPECFRCCTCGENLEHVSAYEHGGMPYCHLDYHEQFAPKCYSCKTSIIEERFISLDDPALGKRTYHKEHFFCAECGDPFLSPSAKFPADGELALADGEFEGFTVYKGYAYCEACHVRLRLPKCQRCKRSIRDHDQAVEALGGKWCWSCFVCANCNRPFDDPSFFERGGQPYCENCFSVMLRNEI